MLDSLRAFSKTWVAKIFFGILIISFAAFGVSSVMLDPGTNTVARVGGQEITLREYQRAYQAQLNRAAQQFGQLPTADQAIALGIPGSVLSQLAADAAINQMAVSMGIGASDARLAKLLREDPSFAGTLGQFERSNFLRVLQQNGFTEKEYFEVQTRAARRQQLAAGLFADAAVPNAAVELVNRYSGDTRTIDYFVLNSTSVFGVEEPTEADLAEYLSANQAQFRTKESRTVDVLVLSPETLAANMTVTDEQIAAEYERTSDSLNKPETRAIRQVVLLDDASRTAFEAGLSEGKSFDALVAETGLTPIELGALSRAQVTDASLADAAFGLAPDAFVIIPGAAGPRAISVSSIDAGGVPALAEVKDTIAQRLAIAAARTQFLDDLDQIEELRAAFTPLADIATRFNIDVSEVTLTADGAALSEVTALPAAGQAQVARAIFTASADKLAPTVALSATTNVWFDIKTIEAARDQTLDEVRDEVRTAVTNLRTEEALSAETDRLVAMLAEGQPLANVAAEVSQFPSLSQPMTRSGDGTPILDAGVGNAVFNGPLGHYGSARNGDGDFVIFVVGEVQPPAEVNADAATFVQEAARDSLFSDFITAVRDDYGVRENGTAMAQLLAPTGQ